MTNDPRIEAALKSLLAEDCFPDFAYYPKSTHPHILAEIHARNYAAVERALVAAGFVSGLENNVRADEAQPREPLPSVNKPESVDLLGAAGVPEQADG